MPKEESYRVRGTIVSQERNGWWVEHGEGQAFCTASRLRRFKISLVPGDEVEIEFGLYSLDQARIIKRY